MLHKPEIDYLSYYGMSKENFDILYKTGNDISGVGKTTNDTPIKRVKNRLPNKKKMSEREHARNVKSTRKQRDIKIANNICPRCGGVLVLRHGRYGAFYGCSNFPDCHFWMKK